MFASMYYENDWLRFHRSWTGFCIYGLQLLPIESADPAVRRVVAGWVNRDPEQYSETNLDNDRRMLRFLIDAFLLHKRDVRFPLPAEATGGPPGLFQHAMVGRGYPEQRGD